MASVARMPLPIAAVAALVFVMPFDGFVAITRIGDVSVISFAGYAALIVVALRPRAVVFAQVSGFWWLAASYLIGTVLAVVAAVEGTAALTKPVATIWQMLALWALTAYGFSSIHGGIRIVRAFLIGGVLSFVLFALFHETGYRVAATSERTLWVAGYRANHAALDSAFLNILIIGTYGWWTTRLRMFLAGIGVPICLYVQLVTNSRGALVVTAGALLVFLMASTRGRSLGKLRGVIAAAGAIAVLTLTIGVQRTTDLIARETMRWTEAETTSELTTRRADILREGWMMAIERPLGYGIGVAEHTLGPRVSHQYEWVGAHNDYLRSLLSNGFVGLSFYLIGIATLYVGVLRFYRAYNGVWVLALMVAFSLFCATSDNDHKLAWICLGFVGGFIRRAQVADLSRVRERVADSGT